MKQVAPAASDALGSVMIGLIGGDRALRRFRSRNRRPLRSIRCTGDAERDRHVRPHGRRIARAIALDDAPVHAAVLVAARDPAPTPRSSSAPLT